jgi:hypothetical protein
VYAVVRTQQIETGTMKKPLLGSCRACGTEISWYSPVCRNCGHPQGSNLAIALLILCFVVLLGSYMASVIYGAIHVERLAAS